MNEKVKFSIGLISILCHIVLWTNYFREFVRLSSIDESGGTIAGLLFSTIIATCFNTFLFYYYAKRPK